VGDAAKSDRDLDQRASDAPAPPVDGLLLLAALEPLDAA
jgi:hypothetical protein